MVNLIRLGFVCIILWLVVHRMASLGGSLCCTLHPGISSLIQNTFIITVRHSQGCRITNGYN